MDLIPTHDEPALPWERQADEPENRFRAFVAYRDLGLDRSFQETTRKLGMHLSSGNTLSGWAKEHEWASRCWAYDVHIDRMMRRGREEAVMRMNEKHAETANKFLDKVIAKLDKIDVDDLSTGDLVRFFDIAVRVERLARGEHTEKVRQDANAQARGEPSSMVPGAFDLSRLSTEDLRHLDRIQRQLAAPEPDQG